MIVQFSRQKIADLSRDISQGENLRGKAELAFGLAPCDEVEPLYVSIEPAGEPLKTTGKALFNELNPAFQGLETSVRLLRFVANLLQDLEDLVTHALRSYLGRPRMITLCESSEGLGR